MQQMQKHKYVLLSCDVNPNSFDLRRSISSHACLEAAIFLTTRGGGKWKRFSVTQSKHGAASPLINDFRLTNVLFWYCTTYVEAFVFGVRTYSNN